VAAFDHSFSNEAGKEDGIKMANTAEAIAFDVNANLLGVNSRKIPGDKDTMFLNVARLTKPQYTLEIFTQQLQGITAKPYLEDTYLNTSVPLSVTDTNRIVFSVNAANTSSSAAGRFRIVFKEMSILPVTFTSIKATLIGADVKVAWKVANESGIQKYEIEHSWDGSRFTKVAEVRAGGGAGDIYTWVDLTPTSGNHYYRIRAIQHDGKSYLTKIVTAKVDATLNPGLVVYPNPVRNQQINYQLTAVEKGRYTVWLHNASGQKLFTAVLDHNGGTTHHVIQPGKTLSPGMYYLEIKSSNAAYHQTVFIK
jgi:hypothetical protein